MIQEQPNESAMSWAAVESIQELLKILEDLEIGELTEGEPAKRSVLLRNRIFRWQQRPALYVLPEHASRARELSGAIRDRLQRISEIADRNDEVKRTPHMPVTGWTLGTVIYQLERHPVLRGHIDVLKSEPIAPDVSDFVFQYLIAIPGIGDWLTREIHNASFGYHFHYLDADERRSDTLLTFDQRGSDDGGRLLTWERHAEGSKFQAKADDWGKKKRKSIYTACCGNAKKISVSDFKTPDSSAKVVWPLPTVQQVLPKSHLRPGAGVN